MTKRMTSHVKRFKIGLVADMDKRSKAIDDEGHPYWRSYILTGTLTHDCKDNKVTAEMQSQDEACLIKSSYSRGLRGMELSELIVYNGKFLAVCDKTGILFQIFRSKVIPRVVLANGDGYQDTGFKGEWMTRKDGNLIVGSHGREYVNNGTIIVNRNRKWIKEVNPEGKVRHIDWNRAYDIMREAVGCPFPVRTEKLILRADRSILRVLPVDADKHMLLKSGYLTHESCVWSDIHKQWFFLPRKVSKEPYDEKKDETRCGNVLLRCNESFTIIKHRTIGPPTPARGYSSFKFVPGTKNQVIIAIKSEEIDAIQKTFITAFNIDGQILLPDTYVADVKYEGLEFIDSVRDFDMCA